MCLYIFICYLLLRFGSSELNGEFALFSNKFGTFSSFQKPNSNINNVHTEKNENSLFKINNLDASENINYDHFYKSARHGNNGIKLNDVSKILHDSPRIHYIEKQHTVSKGGFSIFNTDKYINKYYLNQTNFIRNDNTNAKSQISGDSMVDTSKTFITTEKISPSNLMMLSPPTTYKDKSSKSILFTMKKKDWKPIEGFLGNATRKDRNLKSEAIKSEPKTGEFEIMKRFKRSNKQVEKQRNILLIRRYAQQSKENSAVKAKIVTPDYEYEDPYWNINYAKSSKRQRPESVAIYSAEDYVEDYDVELPRPGLSGIYSDNGKPLPGWTLSNTNIGSAYDDIDGADDYDDSISVSGYSKVDPRIESATQTSKSPIKPMRVITAPEVASYDAESQTISYHSNPDFNVLQGFKLLIRDKNEEKIKYRPTNAEFTSANDSQESNYSDELEASSSDEEDFQITKSCGRTAIPKALKNQGKQIGDTEDGSHPWLAILVSRRNLKKINCYASLIHKRAAITSANCVLRASEDDIVLIAGLWKFNDRSLVKTRVVSTLPHPKFKRGELDNNLALLHWQRPLILGVNVYPVCLNKPHVGDDCMFVGWGGFDQAIRNRSRWQRATIHTCKDRLSLNGVNIPSEGFCASVRSPTTVTGLGGSLVCNINGHVSAVGVAVSRDSTLVLLPVYDWVMQAIDVLHE